MTPSSASSNFARFGGVAKVFESLSRVDHIFAMKDHRIVRMMRQILGFECLDGFVELQIVGIAEPATEEAQVPVCKLFGFAKNVISRLVQIDPVAVLELRGTRWIRIDTFSHDELTASS
jgi:hypothetical protein